MNQDNQDNNHNQWELTGNCNICRRKNYCSKLCTARKRTAKATTDKIIREKTGMVTRDKNSPSTMLPISANNGNGNGLCNSINTQTPLNMLNN